MKTAAMALASGAMLLAAGAAGAQTNSLVYQELEPCRVIDTRSAGGKFANLEQRSYFLSGESTDYSAQGGNPAGCGIPDMTALGGGIFQNTAKAVALNIVAVQAEGNGNLRLFAGDGTVPNASSINYQQLSPAMNFANMIIIPMCGETAASPCATGDITVSAHGNPVNLVADVVGYFYDEPGDISAVTAGTGLSGGADSGDAQVFMLETFRLPQGCAEGDVARWDPLGGVGGAGEWFCDTATGGTGGVGGVLGFEKEDLDINTTGQGLNGVIAGIVVVTASCDDANDVAIAGACHPSTSSAQDTNVLVGERAIDWNTSVSPAQHECTWNYAGGGTGALNATVICVPVP